MLGLRPDCVEKLDAWWRTRRCDREREDTENIDGDEASKDVAGEKRADAGLGSSAAGSGKI